MGVALAACTTQVETEGGLDDQAVVSLASAALTADGAGALTEFADETRVRLQVPRTRPIAVDDRFAFAAGATIHVDVFNVAEERRLALLESFETTLDAKDIVPGAVPVDLPRSFDAIDVELVVTVTDGGGRSETYTLAVPRGTAARLPQRECPHFAEVRQRVPDGALVPSDKLAHGEVER